MTTGTRNKARGYAICSCGWETVEAITANGQETLEFQVIDPDCMEKGVRPVEGNKWYMAGA